jgi:membrane protease YdiL (CAAX protease family)
MKKFFYEIIKIIVYLIAYLIVVGFFQFFTGYLFGIDFFETKAIDDEEFTVLNLGGLIGTIVITWLFTRFVDKKSFVEIGLQPAVKDFGLGALMGFIPIALGFVILYFSGIIHSVSIDFEATALAASILLYISVAINEEIMLRGYILRNLMNVSPKYAALFISALIFALLHITNNHINWIGFVNILLAGILLGLSYIFTKNLWFPIGLHFTWNLFQSVLGFNVSGHNSYSLLHYRLSGEKPWLSGGDFGFEASVLSLVFELILIVITYFIFVKSNKRKSYHF